MNITQVEKNIIPCIITYIKTRGGILPENCYCENKFDFIIKDRSLEIPKWDYEFNIPTIDDLLSLDKTQCKISKIEYLLTCNKILNIIFQASGKSCLEMIQIVENVYEKDIFDIFFP